MHRYIRAIGITLSVMALFVSVGAVAGAVPPTGDDGGSVTETRLAVPGGGLVVVRRDEVGVPHVIAAGFRSVAFGLGYAFAEDNICAMAQIVVTERGERSRWFGADAAPALDLLAPFRTNIESDLHYRSVSQAGAVERLLKAPPPRGPSSDARALVRGYVEGFNRYLSATGPDGIDDPVCRSAPWVQSLTELDIWRHVHFFSTQASASFAEGILTAAPPDGARSASGIPSTLNRFAEARARMAVGSNAVAIGRDASATGAAMVLANPHFPWLGNGRFYRMRLTVPGRLNAAGSAPFGVPVIGLGYNRSLAWSHTVSTAMPVVVHRLELVPGDPTAYLVDGKARRMAVHRVVVSLGPHGGGEVVRTLYRSEHGPIVVLDADHDWSATTAYALQDMNEGNLRQIDTFLAESRARDIDELRAAHVTWQGNPFFNTVAADNTGRVRFDATTVVPHVTDEHAARCVAPEDLPIFDILGMAVLDGSTSDCALGRDPDAVVPGIMGPDRLPELVRTDWVANSNDSPWLTNPSEALAYPRVVGDTGTTRNLRTRYGATTLQQSLADGGRVDRHALTDMVFGNVVFSATLTGRDALSVCEQNPRVPVGSEVVDLRPACAVLREWDGTADVASRGAVLWQAIWRRLQSLPGGAWAVPFDPADAMNTPSGLRRDPAVPGALAQAVQDLAAQGVPLDAPVGAVQRFAHGGRDISLHGCPGDVGCYNAVLTGRYVGHEDPAAVVLGTSHVFVATMHEYGTRAKTVLAYSQSANSKSPHHVDQTELFAREILLNDRVD